MHKYTFTWSQINNFQKKNVHAIPKLIRRKNLVTAFEKPGKKNHTEIRKRKCQDRSSVSEIYRSSTNQR